jgi:hypothetical protein
MLWGINWLPAGLKEEFCLHLALCTALHPWVDTSEGLNEEATRFTVSEMSGLATTGTKLLNQLLSESCNFQPEK